MSASGSHSDLLASDLVERISAPVLAVGSRAWIVGGAVRDAFLGSPVTDIDLAVEGSPEPVARAVADALDGVAFELSDEFATWRATDRAGEWQVDVAALRADGIEQDLRLRDFTVGSIAVALEDGRLVDPLDGRGDLDRGLLRASGPTSLLDDPLRTMRAARLSAQFGWAVEPSTLDLAKEAAPGLPGVAGERVLAEFLLLIGSRDPLKGIEAMELVGAMDQVLPEVGAMRDVTQGPNHHLDVHGHTLEVLEGVLRIESDLEAFTGALAPETSAMLAEPLADGVDRAVGLRLGALFHDCAKPDTRTETDGFIGFRGHDAVGAEKVGKIFGRLRSSRALSRHVADLTRYHLILGFMVHEMPLDRRRIYRYLRDTSPVAVDVTLLTVADRLAARGAGPVASAEMVEAHLELARTMVEAGLAWHADGPPEVPLPGDVLASELGIQPGPELGRVIEELREDVYTGDVNSAKDAVERGRQHLNTD